MAEMCPLSDQGSIPSEAAVRGTIEWLYSIELAQHPEVEQRARWLLLDTVSCIVAGLQYPEVARLQARLVESSPGPVRWPGSTAGLSESAAAAVGAMAACWHEACEGLARAHGRPGLHAVPVAAALGQQRGLSLQAVLECILWGYEIGGRSGESMRIRPGLHVDGTWGMLAACAAAARGSGLTVEQSLTALAAAACQLPASLYSPILGGHTVRNTYAAHAVLQGFFLVDAIAAGVRAPADVFAEAASQLGQGSAAIGERAWAAPGEFMLLQGYLKAFASVRHTHYAASAALRWQRSHGAADATRHIRRIILTTYPEALTYCGVRSPRTPLEAQFSLSYAVAHALRTGSLDPDAYRDAALQHPEQLRLESLVELVVDESLHARAARLQVVTATESWEDCVTAVSGDAQLPFTEDALRDKSRRLLQPAVGKAGANVLTDAILSGALAEPLCF